MSKISIDLSGKNINYSLHLELQLDDRQHIISSHLKARGLKPLMDLCHKWSNFLTGALMDVEVPKGNAAEDMILREALMKAKNQWKPLADEEQMCYCRDILVKTVDEAILLGAHSQDQVVEQTGAGSSCGSCRYDIDLLLQNRLK